MRLSFFTVNSDYCERLRKHDPRVPYTFDAKKNRPFVGIVYSIGCHSYYAPLTSPKPKHQAMKNQVDFLKIAGGAYGAINFNNMIPILPDQCEKIDITSMVIRCEADEQYKNLLENQLSWCNSNIDNILSKARKLYELVTTRRAPAQLLSRCCDFKLLEKVCNQADEEHLLELDHPRKESIFKRLEAVQEKSQRDNAERVKKTKYIGFDR